MRSSHAFWRHRYGPVWEDGQYMCSNNLMTPFDTVALSVNDSCLSSFRRVSLYTVRVGQSYWTIQSHEGYSDYMCTTTYLLWWNRCLETWLVVCMMINPVCEGTWHPQFHLFVLHNTKTILFPLFNSHFFRYDKQNNEDKGETCSRAVSIPVTRRGSNAVFLLWIDKARAKEKTYIWVSVWCKTKS